MRTHIHEHNRLVWDQMALAAARFTRPATEDDLTNSKIVQQGGSAWLGKIAGKRLLCLGAGGGRQSAIYARAGAIVTVVDISPKMLELDKAIAREKNLPITAIEASMDDLSILAPDSFQIVIQPVSTCYVPDILLVYRQVARVLEPQGLYISQHKQPVSLQADVRPSDSGYELIEPYHRKGPLPPVAGSLHREAGTLEYLHTWQAMIGGLCHAGFVIEDLSEPDHTKIDAPKGSFEDRSRFAPPYVLIKARRVKTEPETENRLWLPGGI